MLFQQFHHFLIYNCVRIKSLELLLILDSLIFVFSRSTFLWRSTSMTLWRTALFPPRVLKMAKRDWRRGKKRKSSVPGWIPGNNFYFFPFMPTHLFFSFFSPPSSVTQRTKRCRDFLWVTRRLEANILCTLANHKVTLMSLIYDHFLWLGSKTTNRSRGPRLSPAKSFPQNCCHGIAKSSMAYSSHVKVRMAHAYFSSCGLLIFKWSIKENQ